MKNVTLIILLAALLMSCDKEETTASFSADITKAYLTQTIRFSNGSRHADAFMWDFGDGQTSNEQSPSHAYNQPGIYNVTLSATGTRDASHSETITVLDGKAAYQVSNISDYTLEMYSFYYNELINELTDETDMGVIEEDETTDTFYTNRDELMLAFYAEGTLFMVAEPFNITAYTENTYTISNSTQVIIIDKAFKQSRMTVEEVFK